VPLTAEISLVGLIANPASGKDIRRLVASAAPISNQSKVGLLRRVALGLGALGVRRVLAMPDSQGLALQAWRGLREDAEAPALSLIEMPITDEAQDSERAARALCAAGAGCLVVLGGDGTVRAVSKGAGEVPIVALSTGTNNVLPSFVEGTVAGLAAAAVARGLVPLHEVALRHKWLEIAIEGEPLDRALVDVALVRGRWRGARAVWNIADVRWVIVTRADPTQVGISSIAGTFGALSPQEPAALALRLGAEAPRRVLAVIAPGVAVWVGVAEMRRMAMNETLPLMAEEPLAIALDGEREHFLNPSQRLDITLRGDGPWIVEVPRVLRALAKGGQLQVCSSS